MFAIKIDASTFGIADFFPAAAGRQAHLDGPIVAALMQRADDLLASPPDIKPVDVLAAKLPTRTGATSTVRPSSALTSPRSGLRYRAGPGQTLAAES